MFVGEALSGKSMMIDLFLHQKAGQKNAAWGRTFGGTKGIKEYAAEVSDEKRPNVRYAIKLVDTPGLNALYSYEKWYHDIKEYIVRQMAAYKRSLKVAEKQMYAGDPKKSHNSFASNALHGSFMSGPSNINDPRVHACFYFVNIAKKKRTSEFAYLKKLQAYVNIIPIISKVTPFNAFV
jgi:septin family protein